MNSVVFMALIATLGTWFVTALGAATVVFFKSPNPKVLNLMLGFASGVMIAASFWSLLVTFATCHRASGGNIKSACLLCGNGRFSFRCNIHMGKR